MYPASTTKILTALIALENLDLNQTIKIGNEVYSVPLDASKAGHNPGDEINVKDLLISLLLPSGNDSAFVIASEVAKKVTGNENLNIDEAIAQFAILMNNKAEEIGLTNSHFVNPHGYHDENHYTTAYDLALITKEALKNETFREIVKMSSAQIGDENNPNDRELYFQNRNLLLNPKYSNTYYPYATGVKTGFTDEAGECLVASAQKDGISLIAVLLNSPKDMRWEEAKTLFDYGFDNFEFYQVVEKDEVVGKTYVDKASPKGPDELEVTVEEEFIDLFNKDDISRIESKITWNQEPLIAPITQGDEVGKISFILDGEVLKTIDLKAKYSIEKRTIWDVIFSLKAIPYWIGSILGLCILFTIINIIKKKRRSRGFHLR